MVAFAALAVCAALLSRAPAETSRTNLSSAPAAPQLPAAYEIGANGTCGVPWQIVTGVISSTSPVQTGRMFATNIPGVCGRTTSCAAYDSSSYYPYQQFDFHNSSSDAQCMSVTLDARSCDNMMFSAAYLNSHDPSKVCANYLSSIGHATDRVFTYSFQVPGGAYFSIVNYVINDANPSQRVCSQYGMKVSPCSTNIAVAATQALAGPSTVYADSNGAAVITYSLSYRNTGNYTAVVPSSSVVETALAQPPNAPVLNYGRAGGVIAPGGTTTQSVAVEVQNALLNTCVPTTYTVTARLDAQASTYACNWGNSLPNILDVTGTLYPDIYQDEDSYSFSAKPGWFVTVTLNTLNPGTAFDPKACISASPHGACLPGLYSDDALPCDFPPKPPTVSNPCPMITGTLPAGDIYYLRVNRYSGASFMGTTGEYRATLELRAPDAGLCPLVQALDNGSRAFLAPAGSTAADAMTSTISATSPPVTVVLPAANPSNPACTALHLPIVSR